MHRIKYAIIGTIGLLIAQTALAEVYKCPGPSDTVTLSNVEKGSGCVKMVLPPSGSKKTAAAKPKSDLVTDAMAPEKPKTTYETAAVERKRVIQEELDLEQSRLNTVNARIREINTMPTKTPELVKEQINLQQKQSLHQGNINLLQKELAR